MTVITKTITSAIFTIAVASTTLSITATTAAAGPYGGIWGVSGTTLGSGR